jgi:hypothetical protein
MAVIHVANNMFTRAFGGTNEPAVADAFISGYAFLRFENIPAAVYSNYTGPEAAQIGKILSALVVGVTLPTMDLNKTVIRGQGGTKWAMPTDITSGDTISVRYVELSGTPVAKFHDVWFNLIRDSRTGASNLTGDGYTKSNYSASILYWTTKPDGATVEKAYYFTGVFPQRKPIDSFNYDVNTVDRVEIEIPYNVDNIYVYSENDLVGNSFIRNKINMYINEILAYRNRIQSFNG